MIVGREITNIDFHYYSQVKMIGRQLQEISGPDWSLPAFWHFI
ncbi:hypothetical protein [Bacillus cereus]|nr:hypothetical protein [Bacillus cereus]